MQSGKVHRERPLHVLMAILEQDTPALSAMGHKGGIMSSLARKRKKKEIQKYAEEYRNASRGS